MSEEATQAAKAWAVPAIDGGDGRGYMTASKLEALQKDAYDEAFDRGLADGERKSRDAVAARCSQLDQLLAAFEKPFEKLDTDIEEQLVSLSMHVARQLFRREMKTEPSHIVGVVREALQLLPTASRDATLHLHPDDAEIVRQSFTIAETQASWTLAEDPLLTRGGCRVTTENSSVDASVEARFEAVMSAIVGDERES